MISLKPGDILYYPDNYATALLITKIDDVWHYALRSPLAAEPHGRHYLKIDVAKENMLTDAIEDGRFILYENDEENLNESW